ncbi:hypothetical protein NEFER03_1275 [Nematocida sp. LUAm3]|nr:hypothetical protein NEFER03_1275 [Nematocida sp. LUAm3]KAI5174103.1 hypothetical protein NEFER02_0570 [Nematocida sp. LUAm2]KAI5177154.1 hypothetical protein NEFER01_0429 [Nematocida sp. LUAm1]
MSKEETPLGEDPKSIYAALCEEQQTKEEERMQIAAELLKRAKKGEDKKYLIYASIEVLRIVAPRNPHTPEGIEEIFKYLILKAPLHKEGKRALETVAKYKMVALLDSPKIINSLALVAINHISKSWGKLLLHSIIEEKEEELEADVKMKIVRKIGEGASFLDVYVTMHPILFISTTKEYFLRQDKKVIEKLKIFNDLSKEVITKELVENIIEKVSKKEFLLFIEENTVRKELLELIENMSEDRSSFVRCKVPLILLKKAEDPFYTAALAQRIKEKGLEQWRKRIYDTSSLVRSSLLKLTDIKYMCIPEVREEVLMRIRDIEQTVREEALKKLSEDWIDTKKKRNEHNQCNTSCFLCLDKEKTDGSHLSEFFLPIAMSIFIEEGLKQRMLIRKTFKEIDHIFSGEEGQLVSQGLFKEIHEKMKHSSDVEELTGCCSLFVLLGIEIPDISQACLEDIHTSACLKRILVPNTQYTPPDLSILKTFSHGMKIMLMETYPKSLVPSSLLLEIKKDIPDLSEKNFFRVLRIVNISGNSIIELWMKEKVSDREKTYFDIKRIALSEGTEFSLDLSRIKGSDEEPEESLENLKEKQDLLSDAPLLYRMMVLLDILEDSLRSFILEKSVIKALFTSQYTELIELSSSLFFRQRVLLGAKTHRNPETKLIFSLLSTLCIKASKLQLDSKMLKDLLILLIWCFMEYSETRAAEIVSSLFQEYSYLPEDFFSIFVNLKRMRLLNQEKQRSLYVLSETVYSLLDKEAEKKNINSKQFSNNLPDALYSGLLEKEGWASSLLLLNEDQFTTNLLTTFKN